VEVFKSLALCVILSDAHPHKSYFLLPKRKRSRAHVFCASFPKIANHSDHVLCEHSGISKLLPYFTEKQLKPVLCVALLLFFEKTCKSQTWSERVPWCFENLATLFLKNPVYPQHVVLLCSFQKDDKLLRYSYQAGEAAMYSLSYTEAYRKSPMRIICGCLADFRKINLLQAYGACEQLEGLENI
jgi:hypothetical protein